MWKTKWINSLQRRANWISHQSKSIGGCEQCNYSTEASRRKQIFIFSPKKCFYRRICRIIYCCSFRQMRILRSKVYLRCNYPIAIVSICVFSAWLWASHTLAYCLSSNCNSIHFVASTTLAEVIENARDPVCALVSDFSFSFCCQLIAMAFRVLSQRKWLASCVSQPFVWAGRLATAWCYFHSCMRFITCAQNRRAQIFAKHSEWNTRHLPTWH